MTRALAHDTLLQAAAEVARLAGDVALRYWRTGVAVETKADGSPVTLADRSAEAAARAWIEARFPGDGVLGEELGLVRGEARRCWILDPIDGTKTFVRGVPLWGTLVAVAEGERVLAGAAYFPPIAELVVAAPGEGCWWNERRASVSLVTAIADATVLTTDERFRRTPHCIDGWARLTKEAYMSRSWGDCYGYLLIATGRAEVMVDGIVGAWDTAAFEPIVTEAGGVFTDWSGAATAFGGSAIATNAGVAIEARRLLSEIPLESAYRD
ncbi:MAG: inositol monophosphatase family protein [Gemmatimonadaceae bacterium]